MTVDLATSRVRTASAAALDALAAEAWVLLPPGPGERKDLLRDEAAFLVDRLLTSVARGHGALEVALGHGLASLAEGDAALRLGYSGIGDYARERLGVAAGTAQKLARLARALRDRPLLWEAVRRGEVSARKAETVLPVALGEDEERWVARARTETVRALAAAVREERGAYGEDPERDGPWERFAVQLTPEARAKLDEAMALAGKHLGATAPKWQRLEAICMEFLGAHAASVPDEAPASSMRAKVEDLVAATRFALEAEFAPWTYLAEVKPVEAEVSADLEGGATDPWKVDAELRRLAAMRDGWDELVGHLAMLVRQLGLWRDMQFQSFAHYCAERLGMATRTVEQRAALERRLYALPALRQALRDGRVSYEKARVIAEHADDGSVEEWLRRAEGTTCIALRREAETVSEAQMCARAELDLRMPSRVASLLDAAIRTARAASDRWIGVAECVGWVAAHFVETWKEALEERNTPQKRVLARDRGLCQVPGCSRPAVQVHHLWYRAHGGGDEEANLASLCLIHHLRGIHGGYIHVSGRAPDGLVWRLTRRGAAGKSAEPGPPFH